MPKEQQSIYVTPNGVGGSLVERVFFKSSRGQLESLWKLQNLYELVCTDSLQLPQEIFDYTQHKYAESLADGKERAANIGWENGVNILAHEVGPNSLYDMSNKGFISEFSVFASHESALSFSFRRLFGEPVPIFFHTHPSFTEGSVISYHLKTHQGKNFDIRPDHFIRYIDFSMDTFSTGDLQAITQSNRIYNSMLLLTNRRFIYIAPPEHRLKIGLTKLIRYHSAYDQAMDPILCTAMMYFFGMTAEDALPVNTRKNKKLTEVILKSDSLLKTIQSEEDLKRLRDNTLIDFCDNAGFIAFASRSKNDIVLHRLRH